FAIAQLSRKLPPLDALKATNPAVGGPSRRRFHSSSVKGAFPVIPTTSYERGTAEKSSHLDEARDGSIGDSSSHGVRETSGRRRQTAEKVAGAVWLARIIWRGVQY